MTLCLTLTMVLAGSGCCTHTPARAAPPLPANRPTKPAPNQVREATRTLMVVWLTEAWNYIYSLERDGLWAKED